MRSVVLFALLLDSASEARLIPLTKTDVIRNSGFEAGANETPDAWMPRHDIPAGVALIWSQTNPHTGERCLGIESSNTVDRPWSWWEQSVPLVPGATYRLSGWARTEKLTHSAIVLLSCQDANGNELLRQKLTILPSDAPQWRALSGALTTPPGTVKGRVQFSMHGSGRAYIDDLRIAAQLQPERVPWNRTSVYPVVHRGDTRIVIGGESDWNDIPRAAVDAAYKVSHAEAAILDDVQSSGSGDLSFEFSVQSTTRSFRLRVWVRDDVLKQEQPYWQGDSIQFAIDTKYARSAWYGPGDFVIGVTPSGEVHIDQQPSGSALLMRDVSQSTSVVNGGYWLEVAVPWSKLGIPPPRPNQRIGFALVVNDSDGKGHKWAEWTGGIAQKKSPANYGTLVFLNDGGLGFTLSTPPAETTDLEPLHLGATVVSVTDQPTPVTLTLTVDGGGKELTDVRKVVVHQGVTSVPLVYQTGSLAAGRHTVSLEAANLASEAAFEVLPMRTLLAEIESRVGSIQEKVKTLTQLVHAGRKGELDIALPDATLATAEHFLRFIPADAAREGHQQLALREAQRLEPLVDRAIAEVKVILADPAAHPQVAPPPVMQAVMRDGNWYVSDRPVFLFGFNLFDRTWLADLPRFGGNFDATTGGSAAHFFRNGPQLDTEELKVRVARVRDAAALGIRSDVHFSHRMPPWALEKWPDLDEAEGHFMFYDLDHPEARRLTCDMMEAMSGALKDEPGVVSYDLWNEAAFNRMSKRGIANFRDAMLKKYGTLDQLNAAWGTTYTHFSQVQPVTKDLGQTAAYTDWVRWNNARLTNYIAEMRAAVQRGDPDGLTTVKLSNEAEIIGTLDHVFRERATSRQDMGVDRWALAQLLEIQGCDTRPTLLSPDYAFAWRYPGMAYDLQRSIAPDKPISDSEWHGIQTVYFEDEDQPAGYLNCALWWSYLHGVDMNLTWWWSRTGTHPKTQWFTGSLLTQPQLLDGWARNSLTVQRHALEVVAFQDAESRVRLLFSKPSAILDLHYLDTQRDAYETLNWFGLPIGFVTEEMLLRGFKDLDVLVIPAARHASPGIREAASKLSQSGVTVVFVGEGCLSLTAHGEKLVNPVGVAAKELKDVADFKAVSDLLEDSGALPDVRCIGPDGISTKPVEFRTVAQGGRLLGYFIGLGKEPATITFQRDGKPVTLRSLLTDKQYEGKTTVEPYDFDLFVVE